MLCLSAPFSPPQKLKLSPFRLCWKLLLTNPMEGVRLMSGHGGGDRDPANRDGGEGEAPQQRLLRSVETAARQWAVPAALSAGMVELKVDSSGWSSRRSSTRCSVPSCTRTVLESLGDGDGAYGLIGWSRTGVPTGPSLACLRPGVAALVLVERRLS